MSVSSFLFLSDKAGPVDFDRDTMIVEGVNTIPLCWLALYTADDLKIIHGDEEYQAVLVTSITQARQRFADRIPVLTQTFPGIKEAFEGWAQMLRMAKKSYIKADISAILDSQVAINLTFADVFDDDDEDDENGDMPVDELALYAEEEAKVREALSYFENSSRTAWESLLNITALRHHIIEQNGVTLHDEWPYVVLGIPLAEWLPWKDTVRKSSVDEPNAPIETELPRRPFWAGLLFAFALGTFLIGLLIGPQTKFGYEIFGLFLMDDIAFYFLVPSLVSAAITLVLNKQYDVTPLDRLIPKVIVVVTLVLLVGRAFSSGFCVVN